MQRQNLPPQSLQWLGLAAVLLLLTGALVLTLAHRQEKISAPSFPVLSSQSKHVPFSSPPQRLPVSSARDVWDYFHEIGFTMENLATGSVDVPRIYLANIIDTWARNEDIAFKKSLFYRTMLPLILRVNELISAQRQQLIELLEKKKNTPLSTAEATWMHELAVDYRVVGSSYQGVLSERHLDALLRRVDTIPPSMALGQAAYESAYATSRFAMEGNALFGQWRWGSGILPAEQREELGDYRIADFATPLDSMAAFAKNLNTNKAYREFRLLRQDLRRQNAPLDGYTLAAGLEKYSEKGETYVETLRAMISQNSLTLLDRVKLGSGRPISLIPQWPEDDN